MKYLKKFNENITNDEKLDFLCISNVKTVREFGETFIKHYGTAGYKYKIIYFEMTIDQDGNFAMEECGILEGNIDNTVKDFWANIEYLLNISITDETLECCKGKCLSEYKLKIDMNDKKTDFNL